MASPIYNPIVPCVHPIPGGVYPGRMIRVQGNLPPGAQRFAINLQCGPNTDPRDDIAMHLNFRFVEMCVVRNHLTAMDWGVEETAGGMPLQRGETFEALILCEPQSFKVALNGVHFCEFLHRVPFQRISHITVDGDVHIQFIGFEGAQPPPQQMYMSEPPSYGAYGAPPPAYGAPGYGGAPQGFVPDPAAGVPAGAYQAPYGQPQRRGLGTGAAVGVGVGALAAGGLAGYALAGGFSSSNNDSSEVVYGGGEIPANMEEHAFEQPTEENEYLENKEEENMERGENETVANTEEENVEEQPPEDEDYLENTENEEVDERENEIPAYTEETQEEETAVAEDDDYLENDDE